MRRRAVGGAGLVMAALALAGCAGGPAPKPPDGVGTPTGLPSAVLVQMVQERFLGGREPVAGSFQEVGRTEQAVAYRWSEQGGKWCVTVAALDATGGWSPCFDPQDRTPLADPPAAKVLTRSRLETGGWAAVLTADGERPLELQCGSWAARLIDVGTAEVPGGTRRYYLALAKEMPQGTPQLRVERAAGATAEPLPVATSTTGPQQSCG
ncbi:hypothetical protein ACFYS8_06935 [Kitasatospora sp. NPDC004615]|uniref:hypothetical protein n=1 Tax=Kitasatospora sp. NPDC004615 TaxID=3364017 RepID=UPI00367D421C